MKFSHVLKALGFLFYGVLSLYITYRAIDVSGLSYQPEKLLQFTKEQPSIGSEEIQVNVYFEDIYGNTEVSTVRVDPEKFFSAGKEVNLHISTTNEEDLWNTAYQHHRIFTMHPKMEADESSTHRVLSEAEGLPEIDKSVFDHLKRRLVKRNSNSHVSRELEGLEFEGDDGEESGSGCMENDTVYNDGDLSSVYLFSVTQCRDLCTIEDECTHFTFYTDKYAQLNMHGLCVLKRNSESASDVVGAISGIPGCVSDEIELQITDEYLPDGEMFVQFEDEGYYASENEM